MCIYKQKYLLFRAHIFPCDIPCNTPSIWVWQSSDTVGWGLGELVGTFVVFVVVPVTGTTVVLSARTFAWDASGFKSRLNDRKSVLFDIVFAIFVYSFGEFWTTPSSFACLFIFTNISWYPDFFSNDETNVRCVDATNIERRHRFIFPGAQIFCKSKIVLRTTLTGEMLLLSGMTLSLYLNITLVTFINICLVNVIIVYIYIHIIEICCFPNDVIIVMGSSPWGINDLSLRWLSCWGPLLCLFPIR